VTARGRLAGVADVAQFRAEYRAQRIGRRYSGWLHFAFVTGTCAAVIAFALSRVHQPHLWELAVLPGGFLLSNLVEYLGHRGPMHRLRRGLRLVYQRHTREHHQFFTTETMAAESPRDFKMVLFPPVMLVFFLAAVAGPLAGALYVLGSPNAGWIFAATGVGYYLTYEWLHLAYHQRAESWVWRLPRFASLQQHHARHHDPTVMSHRNFNITFPICDALFGTSDSNQPSAWHPLAGTPSSESSRTGR
jgi:hypothetical protein